MSTKAKEIQKLERELAEEAAESRLDATAIATTQDGQEWLDLRRLTVGERGKELRYLELRGLLVKHPTDANLVRHAEGQFP